MKFAETVKIADTLNYESKIAFVAFCVERCFKEARRHPVAKQQLENLPLLREGLDILWARADKGAAPPPDRVAAILNHVSSYESPAPDQENVLYNYDLTLVQAARVMVKGLRSLQDADQATGRYIAGAAEGPYLAVAAVYTDYRKARGSEAAVTDAALLKLAEGGHTSGKRSLLEGIPDWTRGEIAKKYAENRLKGSAEDDE